MTTTASPAALAPDYIRSLQPYQPGQPIEELARQINRPPEAILKLASNENPLGMSAAARAAAIAAIEHARLYPDGNGSGLKDALARHWQLDSNQIALGNGSNDLLDLIARCFLTPACAAVYSQYAFAVYALACQCAGARHIVTPALDFGHDLAAMLAAIDADTRVVFIANPNNPTGTFLSAAQLQAFIAKVPPEVLIVLDEAYSEYLDDEQRHDSLAWLPNFPNLLITRTFSKIHGLAGLRVGYAVGNAAIIDLLNRVRQPFNVSSPAQAAACAALADEDFIRQSQRVNRDGMAQLRAGLDQLGVTQMPSSANFITARFDHAAAIHAALQQEGMIVRPLANYGLPDWLRISIGLEHENSRLLTALAKLIN